MVLGSRATFGLGGFGGPATCVLRTGDILPLAQGETGTPAAPEPADLTRDWDLAVVYGPHGAPVVYRRQGDENLLVEYGAMTLDIGLRLRVHLLMQAVRASGLPLVNLTPGLRSLQIHHDPARIARADLIAELAAIEARLPAADRVRVPSRTVHLPLSWNDPQAELAMRKSQDLVRPDAPRCPSSIDFIRRINGLADEDAVRRIVLEASYPVLGLGDVYLGAPVATPVDPRHRLVTTKYNPARTWTPENAVGIGGAYMCIYGMEGPGGYQLFGRTIQMRNSWRRSPPFDRNPWLLDFFDRIRFYPVSAQELAEARDAFPHGAFPVRIEERTFDWAAEQARLAAEAGAIARFKATQQAAFDAERDRWKALGLDRFVVPDGPAEAPGDVPAGCTGVESPVAGNLWKFLVDPGARVAAGDRIAIVESMKMEIAVEAPAPGRVRTLITRPGRTVRAGEVLAVMETE